MFNVIKELVKSEFIKNESVHNLELFTLNYWYKAANDYREIEPSFINHVNHLLKDYLHKSPFIFLLFNKLLMSSYKIMFEGEINLHYFIDKVFNPPEIKYKYDKRYNLHTASMCFDRNVKCFLNTFDPIEFYKTFVELCNSEFKNLQPIDIYCRWLYGLGLIRRIIDYDLLKFLLFNALAEILRGSYIYKTGILLYNNFYKKYHIYLSQQKSKEEKKYFKYFQQLTILFCMSSIRLILKSLDRICRPLEHKNKKDKKYKIACKAVDILEHFLYDFLRGKSFIIEPFDAIFYNNPEAAGSNYYDPWARLSVAFSNFTDSISAVFTIRCAIFDCPLDKKHHHYYCEKLERIYRKSYQIRRKIFNKLCEKS